MICAILVAASFPSRAVAVEPEAAAKESLEALYALDYERSLEHLRVWIESDPDNTLGYLSEAGVLWWWEAAEPGTLKRNKDLKSRFESNLAKILRLASSRFDSQDPKVRADAYFSAGLALGIRAEWNLSRGRWLKAYRDGKKGKKYNQRCLQIDPGYYDAYLGTGLFDYLAAHLPGILKIGVSFFIRGDAESGKRSLHLAMQKGRYPLAATQAASNLLNIYILYENDDARAMEILRGLLAAFPDSPYFRFIEVLLLDRAGDHQASRERALDLFRLTGKSPGMSRQRRMSLYCGMDPAHCLGTKPMTAAAAWLTRALESPDRGPEEWRALCRLYRGLAYDILGRREEAVADYRAVLAGPDTGDAHAIAQHCVNAPCRRGRVRKMLEQPFPQLAEQPI